MNVRMFVSNMRMLGAGLGNIYWNRLFYEFLRVVSFHGFFLISFVTYETYQRLLSGGRNGESFLELYFL